MKVPFIKMHGCGNDFVIFDNRNHYKDQYLFSLEKIKQICDRRFSIGCDQILIMSKSDICDCYVQIFNTDGKEVGACGNGTRCIGKIIMNEFSKDYASIETNAGVLNVTKYLDKYLEDLVSVNMGSPKLDWDLIPLSKNISPIDLASLKDGIAVNIGNPHIVFFVDNYEEVDIEKIGPIIENNILFPEKINVNIAYIVNDNRIFLKTWERGAGHTFACGTGACATLVAAVMKGLPTRRSTIIQRGGDLDITWHDDGNIYMVGNAIEAYRGIIKL